MWPWWILKTVVKSRRSVVVKLNAKSGIKFKILLHTIEQNLPLVVVIGRCIWCVSHCSGRTA